MNEVVSDETLCYVCPRRWDSYKDVEGKPVVSHGSRNMTDL